MDFARVVDPNDDAAAISVEPGDVFDARMALAGATLGPAARKVLLHISQNRVAVLASSAAEIAAAVAALQPCNRVVVFGIGPSAPIAGYVLIMLQRCGRQGFALDATGLALADQLLQLRSGDGLLVLAYGQPYREVEAVFAEAR